MAVYEPRLDWLREQLLSLEAQTYPNLKLYIRDDCSPTVPFYEIQRCVEECIHSFPFVIERNEKNVGSNLTFERLTQEAEGEYLVFCDQDDIWLPDKLEILQRVAENENAELVCSDMYIIDGNGRRIADSITKIRRHHKFRSGTNLTDTLWYSNFASGCALLASLETAKKAVPFDPFMYYDHYIAFFCANCGKVISLETPLILHREHGGNQSSTLQGVSDKKSYYRIRVDRTAEAVYWLRDHFECDDSLKGLLSVGAEWMNARQQYAHGDKTQWRTIWQFRHFSPMASLLEIVLPYLPMPIFQMLLWASRNNYI
ncbi:MAG: glycosyltransferase [Clostridia bacterium]|nr:glycosyltransferase [Clostridia bacterium]